MSSLQNKLTNYEVNPPADAWGRIAAALDEQELPNRLYNLEAAPPAAAWENIAASLDVQEYPDKLYNMEIAPPASAWSSIQSSLHEEAAPVVSMKRRMPLFVRYAAAAVLIGLVAFGIAKWTNHTSTNNGLANSTKDSLKGTRNPSAASSDIASADQTAPGKQIALADNKLPIAQAKSTVRRSSRPVAIANYEYQDSYDDQYSNPIYAYENHVPDIADRYIMLMTPEGNIIRMSKKLGNLVCCVSGEEQDADCKSQLKKWQEKMAASSVSASSDNFLDILNLVGSLQDGGTEL